MPRHDTVGAAALLILVDRYNLTELLGEGGMARVYRGYDHRLKVWRAVKVLDPKLATMAKLRARFEGEAQMMASLEHVNIVRVYDVGFSDDVPFIVMELIEGGSPSDWIDRYGAMPLRLALGVTAQVCMGLFSAHTKGVIHRDIKPSNVLVTLQGLCKVSDFGIARISDASAPGAGLTKTGSIMGTLGFMSPEQRTDAKSVDLRADIYATGAMLYMLATNDMPMDLFAATQDDEMLAAVPEPLRDVIRRATAYRREDRYSSAQELAAELLKLRQTVPPDPSDTPSIVLYGPKVVEVPILTPPTPAAAPQSQRIPQRAPEPTEAEARDPGPVIIPSVRWKNLPGDSPRHVGPAGDATLPLVKVDAPPLPQESELDRGPPVDFDVSAPDGPRLIVHFECEPKRVLGNGRPLEGTIAIRGMLHERRLQAAIAVAAQAAQVPTNRAWCWTQGRGNFKEHISHDDLGRRTRALEDNSAACDKCTARVDERAFGCLVQVPSVFTARAEEWLMDRLLEADQPGGQLCVQMLKEAGVTGKATAIRRAEGQFERKEPVVKIMKSGWLFNTRVNSDQVFEALVYSTDGETVDPPIALSRCLWFGAVRAAASPDAELQEAHVDQLLAMGSASQRQQRTVLNVGPPSEDYAIRSLQRVLGAMYLAWTHDVRLLIET